MLRELLRATLDGAVLNQYGVPVIRTMTTFGARWIMTADNELILSPDLRGDDLAAIEACLIRRTRQERVDLRLVPGPRRPAE